VERGQSSSGLPIWCCAYSIDQVMADILEFLGTVKNRSRGLEAVDLKPAEWGSTVILRRNNPQDLMSALGHKRTSNRFLAMSALPPKADIR